MTSAAHEDFAVTREVISKLDGWLRTLAAPQLPLVRVKASDAQGDFHWEFRNHDGPSLLVGKAVRMVSGIHAAMRLADEGYPTECVSLLRMVSDFAHEIIAIGEGVLEGRMTRSQQKFIDQFFEPIPKDHEEHATNEREYYVSREDLFAPHQRIMDKTTKQTDLMRKLTRYLNFGYDKYVHGHHLTATELYNGHEHRFVVDGSMPELVCCRAARAVAGKIIEVVLALRFMAMVIGNRPVSDELGEVAKRLEQSDEQSYDCLRNGKK